MPRRAVLRVQVDPDVHMLACPNCRACSASHMPRPEVLAGYYASYYDDRDREITFSAPVRFAKHVVGTLPRRAFVTHARILDFGGGDGSLGKAVAERLMELRRISTAEVLVIDFTKHADVSDERVSVRFQSPAVTIDGKYDFVLASAILEHIPDLHAVLQTLYASIA